MWAAACTAADLLAHGAPMRSFCKQVAGALLACTAAHVAAAAYWHRSAGATAWLCTIQQVGYMSAAARLPLSLTLPHTLDSCLHPCHVHGAVCHQHLHNVATCYLTAWQTTDNAAPDIAHLLHYCNSALAACFLGKQVLPLMDVVLTAV